MLVIAWPLLVLPVVGGLALLRPALAQRLRIFDLLPHPVRPTSAGLVAVAVLLILDLAVVRSPARPDFLGETPPLLGLDAVLLGGTAVARVARPLSNRALWMVATALDLVLLLVFAAAD